MTIATCLVLPEGVIFGADSTTSADIGHRYHYLNHNQKILELGEGSTLAVMTWGLSGFDRLSYRTLAARLSDEFGNQPPESVRRATERWAQVVWDAYTHELKDELARVRVLEAKASPNDVTSSDKRSDDEDQAFRTALLDLRVSFCLGGYVEADRMPRAYNFTIDPTLRSPPVVSEVEGMGFWGQPSLFMRLVDGYDYDIREAILKSEYWSGTPEQLDSLLANRELLPAHMTIRDGVDYVHFSIYATIKAFKFSSNDQVCGGPIELAVITSDRKFRWVKHKTWDSAIATI